MNRLVLGLIAGCALSLSVAGPGLCEQILGTVMDSNGHAVPGAKIVTETQDGQKTGSAVTDASGQYRIDALTPGLYYITLDPATSGLQGQTVAGYVGSAGLTVNWAASQSHGAIASAVPGTQAATAGGSAGLAGPAVAMADPVAQAEEEHHHCGDGDKDEAKCCKKHPNDEECREHKSKKRHHHHHHEGGEGGD